MDLYDQAQKWIVVHTPYDYFGGNCHDWNEATTTKNYTFRLRIDYLLCLSRPPSLPRSIRENIPLRIVIPKHSRKQEIRHLGWIRRGHGASLSKYSEKEVFRLNNNLLVAG